MLYRKISKSIRVDSRSRTVARAPGSRTPASSQHPAADGAAFDLPREDSAPRGGLQEPRRLVRDAKPGAGRATRGPAPAASPTGAPSGKRLVGGGGGPGGGPRNGQAGDGQDQGCSRSLRTSGGVSGMRGPAAAPARPSAYRSSRKSIGTVVHILCSRAGAMPHLPARSDTMRDEPWPGTEHRWRRHARPATPCPCWAAGHRRAAPANQDSGRHMPPAPRRPSESGQRAAYATGATPPLAQR